MKPAKLIFVSLFATLVAACSTSTPKPPLVPLGAAQPKISCRSVSAQTAYAADILARPELVEAVYEYREHEQLGQDTLSHLRGARIMVGPEPGVPRPTVDRALQCRLVAPAASTKIRNDVDPLAVGHADVQVTETGSGYVVVIRSDDESEAQEIVRRSDNLLARALPAQSQPSSGGREVGVK